MKAVVKSLLVLVVTLVSCMAVQAVSPKNYFFDTKEENGKIVSKTIFLNENDLLNKEVMYEFSYNTDGKVAEKRAYKWSKSSDSWEPLFLITYEYAAEDGSIQSNLSTWNKKQKSFVPNTHSIEIPAADYDTIFS